MKLIGKSLVLFVFFMCISTSSAYTLVQNGTNQTGNGTEGLGAPSAGWGTISSLTPPINGSGYFNFTYYHHGNLTCPNGVSRVTQNGVVIPGSQVTYTGSTYAKVSVNIYGLFNTTDTILFQGSQSGCSDGFPNYGKNFSMEYTPVNSYILSPGNNSVQTSRLVNISTNQSGTVRYQVSANPDFSTLLYNSTSTNPYSGSISVPTKLVFLRARGENASNNTETAWASIQIVVYDTLYQMNNFSSFGRDNLTIDRGNWSKLYAADFADGWDNNHNDGWTLKNITGTYETGIITYDNNMLFNVSSGTKIMYINDSNYTNFEARYKFSYFNVSVNPAVGWVIDIKPYGLWDADFEYISYNLLTGSFIINTRVSGTYGTQKNETFVTAGIQNKNVTMVLKVRAWGSNVSAKLWNESEPEPDWQLTISNRTIGNGSVGLINTRSNLTVDDFIVRNVSTNGTTIANGSFYSGNKSDIFKYSDNTAFFRYTGTNGSLFNLSASTDASHYFPTSITANSISGQNYSTINRQYWNLTGTIKGTENIFGNVSLLEIGLINISTISGYAKNSTGYGINNTIVISGFGQTLTNSAGYYLFRNASAGNYSVVAGLSGYDAKENFSYVDGENDTVLNFTLSLSTPSVPNKFSNISESSLIYVESFINTSDHIPILLSYYPQTPFTSSTGTSITFMLETAYHPNTIQWTIDGVTKGWNNKTSFGEYTNSTAGTGTYNVTATICNDYGCISHSWAWTVSIISMLLPPRYHIVDVQYFENTDLTEAEYLASAWMNYNTNVNRTVYRLWNIMRIQDHAIEDVMKNGDMLNFGYGNLAGYGVIPGDGDDQAGFYISYVFRGFWDGKEYISNNTNTRIVNFMNNINQTWWNTTILSSLMNTSHYIPNGAVVVRAPSICIREMFQENTTNCLNNTYVINMSIMFANQTDPTSGYVSWQEYDTSINRYTTTTAYAGVFAVFGGLLYDNGYPNQTLLDTINKTIIMAQGIQLQSGAMYSLGRGNNHVSTFAMFSSEGTLLSGIGANVSKGQSYRHADKILQHLDNYRYNDWSNGENGSYYIPPTYYNESTRIGVCGVQQYQMWLGQQAYIAFFSSVGYKYYDPSVIEIPINYTSYVSVTSDPHYQPLGGIIFQSGKYSVFFNVVKNYHTSGYVQYGWNSGCRPREYALFKGVPTWEDATYPVIDPSPDSNNGTSEIFGGLNTGFNNGSDHIYGLNQEDTDFTYGLTNDSVYVNWTNVNTYAGKKLFYYNVSVVRIDDRLNYTVKLGFNQTNFTPASVQIGTNVIITDNKTTAAIQFNGSAWNYSRGTEHMNITNVSVSGGSMPVSEYAPADYGGYGVFGFQRRIDWNGTVTGSEYVLQYDLEGNTSNSYGYDLNQPPGVIEYSPETPHTSQNGTSQTFTITLSQNIDTIQWSINGTTKEWDNGTSTGSYTNTTAGDGFYIVNATACNPQGCVTQPWNWTVAGKAPGIDSYRVKLPNNTYLNVSSLSINTSDTLTFNVTANQTITTWNWSRNGYDFGQNYDNISLSFYLANMTSNVSVYGTNSNGTTNFVNFSIYVIDNGTYIPPVVSPSFVPYNDTYDGFTEFSGTEDHLNWTDNFVEVFNETSGGGNKYIQYLINTSSVTNASGQFNLTVNGRYQANLAHSINVTVLNSTSSLFDKTCGTYTNSASYSYLNCTSVANQHYRNVSGVITVKLLHVSSGVPSHRFYLNELRATLETTSINAPNITKYFNNYTGWNQTTMSINVSNPSFMNVTTNQTANITFSINGTLMQNSTNGTWNYTWPTVGVFNVTMQANNSNGSTQIVYTIVSVLEGGSPPPCCDGGGGIDLDYANGWARYLNGTGIGSVTVTTPVGTTTTNGAGYYSFGYIFVHGTNYSFNFTKTGYDYNLTYGNFVSGDFQIVNGTMNGTVTPPGANPPAIIQKNNSYTNDSTTSFSINKSNVTFWFISNQSLLTCVWTVATSTTCSGTTGYAYMNFTTPGVFNITAYGTNANGSTNITYWLVTVNGTGNLSVSGYVLNVLEAPLNGARVDLNSTLHTFTGVDGYYSFNGVVEGSYSMLGRAIDYDNLTQSLTVTNSTTLNFTLIEHSVTQDGLIIMSGAMGIAGSLLGAGVVYALLRRRRMR